jgi:predicted nucleic acid-binding protein
VRLAADANVLLSALVGGQARRVIGHPSIEEILTPATVMAEVQEYASHLARQKRLPLDVVLLAAATLPVTVIDRALYAEKVLEATRRIGKRDPDDVELLALALHFDLVVWSNDDDFEDANVRWVTTAELLAQLDRRR